MTRDAFDPGDFLADFLTEAGEHLATLDDVLLALERVVAERAPVGDDLINVLFRAIHTLKGMAGMMNFAAFAHLAHDLEQIFDEVRQGQRHLVEADMPALFEGFDALKRLHAHLAATGAEAGLELSGAIAAVATLMAQRAPLPAPPPAATPEPATAPLLERLDDQDQMDALVAVAKGRHLYELHAVLGRDCAEVGVAEWLDGVGLLGGVLGLWAADGQAIDAAGLQAAPADAAFDLLLITEADCASVHDCTGLPAGAVRPAALPWAAPAPAAALPTPATPPPGPLPAVAAPAERATSIRVETARLDRLMELVGELVIHHTRLGQLNSELPHVLDGPGGPEAWRPRLDALTAALAETMQSVSRVSDELQESTMRVRMVPVGTLFSRFPRILRDMARDCGKAARLAITGGETELDKTVIEQIGDPLIHLLRNAVDHGLEGAADRLAAGKPPEGVITLAASQQGHHITITVADDGRGIDRARVLAKARAQGLVGEGDNPSEAEIHQLLFRPGFSTAEAVTSLSGRGVGMDVVMQNIRRLGGSLHVHSERGAGTRFQVKLPLTLAIAKALLVRAGGHTFAVPLASVDETLRLTPDQFKTVHDQEIVQVRGHVLPLFRLSRLFDMPADDAHHRPAVIVSDGERKLALVVDALVGQQDVVVKSLGDYLGQVPGIGGATILGDGRVALILDVPTLLAGHTALPAPA
jgi:two-component system chemotaxis sensor kinase CheA